MALTHEDKEFIKMTVKPITVEMEHIGDRLDKINGSVGRHEAQISEALTERATNREHQKQVETKVDKALCKAEQTEDDLLEYKVVKKYPKFSLAAMFLFGACLVLLTLSQFGVFG